jgi:hypothetical protein
MLPSNGVLKKLPRQGPFEPGPVCGITPPPALSLLKTKIVFVLDARFLDGIEDLTDAVVHLGDDVGEHSAARGGSVGEA